VTVIGGHVKHLGTILIIAGIAAFIAPRLNVNLPQGLSLPTWPTDILGNILLLAGVFWNVFYDVNK
jgi:hypothetical protein